MSDDDLFWRRNDFSHGSLHSVMWNDGMGGFFSGNLRVQRVFGEPVYSGKQYIFRYILRFGINSSGWCAHQLELVQ